ncbi:hypothetical protein [Aureimonas psammosilenae]|nr:hypothetical protein [Aureimonas psammosilenae]
MTVWLVSQSEYQCWILDWPIVPTTMPMLSDEDVVTPPFET